MRVFDPNFSLRQERNVYSKRNFKIMRSSFRSEMGVIHLAPKGASSYYCLRSINILQSQDEAGSSPPLNDPPENQLPNHAAIFLRPHHRIAVFTLKRSSELRQV